MKTVLVSFAMERETKNAFRFAEVDAKGKFVEMADAVVGTIYMKKSTIGDVAPKSIRATFEVEMGKASAKPAKTETKVSTSAKKVVAVKKAKKTA
jgi:hypothetical protein